MNKVMRVIKEKQLQIVNQEMEIDVQTNVPIGKIECCIRKKNAEMIFGIFENMFEIQIEKKE